MPKTKTCVTVHSYSKKRKISMIKNMMVIQVFCIKHKIKHSSQWLNAIWRRSRWSTESTIQVTAILILYHQLSEQIHIKQELFEDSGYLFPLVDESNVVLKNVFKIC